MVERTGPESHGLPLLLSGVVWLRGQGLEAMGLSLLLPGVGGGSKGPGQLVLEEFEGKVVWRWWGHSEKRHTEVEQLDQRWEEGGED